MIEVQQVSYRVKEKALVNNVSLHASTGEFVVIMGANGAGKSTLLRMMAGGLKASAGRILLQGKPLQEYGIESLARKRSVLSQHYHIEFPMSAREIVMMGRYPYFNHEPHTDDETIVDEMMRSLEVETLAGRNYQTLSGGEAQKVQMSRVLAQIGRVSAENQKLLLLDEPVSHLDIKFQHQLLQAARSVSREYVAVVAVLHDVNLALKYADRICFMKEGEMIETLHEPASISTNLLRKVFDIDASIIDHGTEKFVIYR
ncbi:MAG: heme ABC transporter ATP-binding protein [Chitinophagaceae bacterium]|nr:heme ABC transporter ATP-binding protein [Chitinophagaceae bacterium]